MSDADLPLFAGTHADAKPKYWTVTELTHKIRGLIEPAFKEVWIQGEVSNLRPAASGHVYFSLKDNSSSISAAIFGWGAKRGGAARFELEDGLEVLCRGKLSVYPPRGSYQLVVDQIEPLGAGALQVAFEQLKAKLAAEGLFAPERKRELPAFPRRIAVITSPTGAVIQDILNVLGRRAPQIQVLVVPALVQGSDAPRHLIRAVEAVNRHQLGDVLILARGGGSMEDLWCFNDEALVRAIVASQIPTISAVGHETDFTISDFVADLRAPTPSAAAEIISHHWVDVRGSVLEARSRLVAAITRDLNTKKQLLSHIAARVISPKDRLREQAQRLDDLLLRLERAMRTRLERRRATVEQWMGKLGALSPLKVLERGYSIVRAEDPAAFGTVIRSASDIQSGQKLRITFHDGDRQVQAVD